MQKYGKGELLMSSFSPRFVARHSPIKNIYSFVLFFLSGEMIENKNPDLPTLRATDAETQILVHTTRP